MSEPAVRVGQDWLALREGADAAARAPDLVEILRTWAAAWVIHDLGAGTGAMGRWLAPQLPGPQHWLLHDRDTDLLEVATRDLPDGAGVTVAVRDSELTQLHAGDFADATLITASALLDMLTAAELDALVTACAGAGCPVLLALTVVGRVSLDPCERLDSRLAAAFNAHQRRVTPRGRLLGPDAVTAAVDAFRRRSLEPVVRPSPWRLGPDQRDLAAAWLRGWVTAACEQEGALAGEAASYVRRRLAQAQAGQLAVTVDHADLLVLPADQSASKRGESA